MRCVSHAVVLLNCGIPVELASGDRQPLRTHVRIVASTSPASTAIVELPFRSVVRWALMAAFTEFEARLRAAFPDDFGQRFESVAKWFLETDPRFASQLARSSSLVGLPGHLPAQA